MILVIAMCILQPMYKEVQGNPEPEPSPAADRNNRERLSTPEQELLTKYLLSRLIDQGDLSFPDPASLERRDDQDPASSIVYPQVVQQRIRRPLQKLLDQAKENIDVIDFRNPEKQYFDDDHSRYPRQPDDRSSDHDDHYNQHQTQHRTSPSEAVPVFLPFPGTEPNRKTEGVTTGPSTNTRNRFSMPLTMLGEKKYYIGMFFKANWFKAEQYCRFHGMHLASINSMEEQKNLEEHIQSFGMGDEHFWTSGTDQAEEGKFFWMSSGKPITYENWNAGEPNNFQYENGEEEHCLELWNRDGKGLRWNDTPCSFETFFVCEV